MKHSEKFLRQRKFALMLPVLVLPFLTMLFWTLGGGQGVPAQTHAAPRAGLNLQLPDANFGTREVWDKLSLYELAAADSARYREARESDPYFDLITVDTQHPATDTVGSKLMSTFKQKERFTDPNEKRVTDKLEQLYAEINKPSADPITIGQLNNRQPATGNNRQAATDDHTRADQQFTSDVDRLEQMMELLHTNGEPDPEMQQIENVLEKILDIQHPQRITERYQSSAKQHGSNTFTVQPVPAGETVSLLQTPDAFTFAPDSLAQPDSFTAFATTQNGFFGLDAADLPLQTSNTFAAVVHDTQEVVTGATIRLRLVNPIDINGVHIAKDQFIYGVCAINDERLTIQINSIRSTNLLLPVSLEVFDLDGLPGLYIPGAITRDAAKQASENALQNFQVMSLDPSLSAQAAAAGVEAAKGLFSKKAKLIKVTVKAGYQLLLKDTKPTTPF